MNKRIALIVVVLVSCAAVTPAQNTQQQKQDPVKNFVSCPVVQDTKTVPCWVSEYRGELYYLGIQSDISADFHPPYLGHKVLVEGILSGEPRICGGIVLKPVVVSTPVQAAFVLIKILPL